MENDMEKRKVLSEFRGQKSDPSIYEKNFDGSYTDYIDGYHVLFNPVSSDWDWKEKQEEFKEGISSYTAK